jgi:hypothetical protein
VHKLRTLTVPTDHDFRARAPRRRLVDQIKYGGRACGIPAREETYYTHGVVHALDGKTAGAAQRWRAR